MPAGLRSARRMSVCVCVCVSTISIKCFFFFPFFLFSVGEKERKEIWRERSVVDGWIKGKREKKSGKIVEICPCLVELPFLEVGPSGEGKCGRFRYLEADPADAGLCR